MANDVSDFQQRCSGHRNGCDRCRRTSSTCTYSHDGKTKGNRKDSRNAGQASSADGPLPSSVPKKRSSTMDEQQVSTDAGEAARKASTPSPKNAQDTSLTDIAMDFVEYDIMSDQNLNDLLPGLDVEMDNPLFDGLTLPSLTDLDQEFSFPSESSFSAGSPSDLMTCKLTCSSIVLPSGLISA